MKKIMTLKSNKNRVAAIAVAGIILGTGLTAGCVMAFGEDTADRVPSVSHTMAVQETLPQGMYYVDTASNGYGTIYEETVEGTGKDLKKAGELKRGDQVWLIEQENGYAVISIGNTVYFMNPAALKRIVDYTDFVSEDEAESEDYIIESPYDKGIAVHPAPDKDSDVIERLPKGAVLEVLYVTDDNYGYASYDSKEGDTHWGWVNLDYAESFVDYGDTTYSDDLAGCYVVGDIYEVKVDGLFYREEPGKSYNALGKLDKGEFVQILAVEPVDGDIWVMTENGFWSCAREGDKEAYIR